MSLQKIANKMKREINAKSPETEELRTVRMSVVADIVEQLSKSSSAAAKKAYGILNRDINRSYKQGKPLRRGELKKAFEVLNNGSSKKSAKKQTKKAA